MTPYGFVYLTRNIKNGKMYIGQTHYRQNLCEKYFGSGKAIRRALKVHGAEAFTREKIFEAFTKEGLDWAERVIIADHDAVRSKMFYNIAPGGRASLGFTGKQHTAERNRALSEKMLTNHPRAYKVTIDGVTYQGIGAAATALNTTSRRIHEYLKSGIHPRDQINKGRGHKKGTIRSTRNTWILTREDGTAEEVVGLAPWCIKNNVPYSIRDHKGVVFHGWILTRPFD